MTASRDAVDERSAAVVDGLDDVYTQRLAAVLDQESSAKNLDHKTVEAESGGMRWLLGDDGLSASTSSSGDLLFQINNSATRSRPWPDTGASAERCNDDAGTRIPPDDEVLEELIGAASPLANLPTETDVDALIDLLRTSPTSSKPISHTSTISINDILDDDLDLEAEADPDPSLSNLVDGYPFDDLVSDRGARTVLETVSESHDEEPNGVTDHQGFGFGFGSEAFGGDRIGEDIAEPIGDRTAADNTDRDLKSVEDIVEPQFSEATDHPRIFSDSTTVNDCSAPETGLARDDEHDSNQPDDAIIRSEEEATEDLVEISRESTSFEEPPQSCGVVEKPDLVENPDNTEVVEALGVLSNVTGADDKNSGQFLDLSCRPVEQVDLDVDDGQSLMKSVASTQQGESADHECQKFAAATSLDSADGKVVGNKIDERRSSKQSGRSKVVQSLARGRSFELKTGEEDDASTVEVGKDNVTWLTAYFEGVHADQCPGCQVCLTGTVERPFVIQRRSSLPVGTGTGFTSPGEFVRKNPDGLPEPKPMPTPAVDSASGRGRSKPILGLKHASDAAVSGQASNSLPARFEPAQASAHKEPRQGTDPGFRYPLSSATAEDREPDPALHTRNVSKSTTSRRVVSLPDVSDGSTSRTREGQIRADFRFRVAKVHSHSLRSFNDLTASGVAKKRSAESGRPQVQRLRSSADRQQPIQNVNITDGPTAARKSSDSKSFDSGIVEQTSPGSSRDRAQSVDEVGGVAAARKTAATVSLDNILSELCSPTMTEKDPGSSLTPDMIRMYRIEPQRRVPAQQPPPRRGSRQAELKGRGTGQNIRGIDDDALRRIYNGLEQRIDAMLFNVDTRWSDDEWLRPSRRNVPRTTATVPSPAADANHPYSVQQVSSSKNIPRERMYRRSQILDAWQYPARWPHVGWVRIPVLFSAESTRN